MFRSALVILLQLALYGHSADDWCYTDPVCGPSTWYHHYANCDKTSQSPINIDTSEAVPDSSLGAIQINGAVGYSGARITNNGHSVEVTLNKEYTLSGAGLGNPYKLAGFHLHFGDLNSDEVGSEHRINGKGYPLEVHFVFYNIQYEDLTEAKTKPNGLAVVGVLFQINTANEALNEFIQQLPLVAYKGQAVSSSIDLGTFLPSNLQSYYKYQGSLTTPTCSENVTWLVLDSIQNLSWSQYQSIVTSLYYNTVDTIDPEPMQNNFRPTQPLNGRTVYHSA
ncbi:carbonic anhydrase 1-like [Spea bombifrons]|uniref:carbonic anhydrase 1-like n=1 Tax=Spea bombifrons TaxID=233779 RepID=UPI00234985E8|nr:carbonic anhydrase 1-like [Spea bombifrons]